MRYFYTHFQFQNHPPISQFDNHNHSAISSAKSDLFVQSLTNFITTNLLLNLIILRFIILITLLHLFHQIFEHRHRMLKQLITNQRYFFIKIFHFQLEFPLLPSQYHRNIPTFLQFFLHHIQHTSLNSSIELKFSIFSSWDNCVCDVFYNLVKVSAILLCSLSMSGLVRRALLLGLLYMMSFDRYGPLFLFRGSW